MTVQQLQGWFKRWQEKGRQAKDRLLEVPAIELVVRIVKEIGHDDVTHFAAGVAYYAFLSLFPLILGLIALAGFFINREVVQAQIFEFVNRNVPTAAGLVEQNINNIQRLRGPIGLASILGLFWAASAVFGAISRSINRAWDIRETRPFYIAKPRQLAMAVAVFVLLLLSAGLDAFSSVITQFDLGLAQTFPLLQTVTFDIITRLLSLALVFLVFLLLYKYVPNTETRWSDVWPGALLGAVLFEAGKAAFVFYLNNFANYQQVYGSLATIVILLVWLYYSGIILLVGAEFSSEYSRMRRGIEQAGPLPERKAATRESVREHEQGQ